MIDAATATLARRDLVDWLRLIRSENVGPVTFRNLLACYGSAGAALEALPELARRGGRRRPVRIASKAQADREMAAIDKAGATILPVGSPAYPAPLAAIDDAPPLLFALGHTDLLTRPAVALVGARNASANGRRMARELAAELAADGYVITSGLARGIDAAAHAGALNDGTAAVLAGGLDVIYPQENTSLYHEIVERGVVVAENALGTEPQARHFPRRNRVISGISLGLVVVEAALKSGSLISARLAGEQGREVMAVPGSPLDSRASGCNRLLKQGAVLVERADDVRTALARHSAPGPEEGEGGLFALDGPTAPAEPDTDVLHEARREILELMGPTPVAVDELIRECELSPSIVTMVLLELELAGRCERHPGNRAALVGGGAV